MPSTFVEFGALIRYSCFSFESAHNYFKEIARTQNFINLAKSLALAQRCQLLECCNFGDSQENPDTHPLFSTDKKYGE